MTKLRRYRPLLLIGLVLGVIGITQAQAPLTIVINRVDSAAFPEVQLYLTVADSAGLPVLELSEADFLLGEDNQPVSDFSVARIEEPAEALTLSIALDISGSMAGQPLTDTQAAVSGLMAELTDNDQIALLTFNDAVTPLLPLTTIDDVSLSVLDELTAEGKTAFNDAAFEAVEQLAGRQFGRRAVIILTDGENTAGALTLDDVINKARAVGVPVYVIGFGENLQPEVLTRLTRVTGGHFYHTPNSTEVSQSFQAVLRLLRQQYRLTFSSSLPADNDEHALAVRVIRAGVQGQAEGRFVAHPSEVTLDLPDLTDGDQIAGIVALTPRIVAPAPIEQVTYLVDSEPVHQVNTAPFAYKWNTAELSPGPHTLTIYAVDNAENEADLTLSVVVEPPLTVNILAPDDGMLINQSSTVKVEARAAADVDRVVLAVDGQEVAVLDAEPYTWTWDTASLAPAEYTLTATAYDIHGNEAGQDVTIKVAFHGSGWGVWVAFLIVVLSAGIVLPLAWRIRQRRLRQL